jgi:lysozyme
VISSLALATIVSCTAAVGAGEGPTTRTLLRVFEGYSSTPYKDTRGNVTIGYGHKLPPSPSALDHPEITLAQAEEFLDVDLDVARAGAMNVFGTGGVWGQLKPSARVVLTVMVFQVGAAGASKFLRLKKCLQRLDYIGAASEMVDSRWCLQTPGRVRSLAALMCEGE